MALEQGKVIPMRQRPGQIGIRMDQVAKQRIDWFSRGRMAYGNITICDGDPGLGKSTLLMDLAATTSQGLPLTVGDPPPRKRGVLLLCLEDDAGTTIRPRLEVAKADLTQITLLYELPVYDKNTNQPIPDATRMVELPDDVPLIEELCRKLEIGLLIIDPLIGFMGDGLNDNDGKDIRKALQPLVKAIQRTDTCCVMLRHLNKGQSANSLYRGAGSVQIAAIARLVMLVAKHPDDPNHRVLAMTKSNLGPMVPSLVFSLESVENEDVARVAWHGTTDMTSDDLLNSSLLTEEQKAENDEATELLLALLSDQPRSEASMKKSFLTQGLAVNAMKRARTRMKTTHKLRCTRVGGVGDTDAVWLWHLPNVDPRQFNPSDSYNTGERVGLVERDSEIKRNQTELRKYGSD